MKAVVIREYGSNDVVRIEDIDRTQPGVGEVLVKVHAAGVNPIDWKIRGGAGERLGMALPIALGSELVGTVEALGDDVGKFERGELVFGMVHSGAFAEYAIAKAADLVRTPSTLDVVHAAALPLAGTTAWQALFDEAGLVAGQRLHAQLLEKVEQRTLGGALCGVLRLVLAVQRRVRPRQPQRQAVGRAAERIQIVLLMRRMQVRGIQR